MIMRLLQFDDTQRNTSKRKRAEEVNVPEVSRLDAMIVSMPNKGGNDGRGTRSMQSVC